MNREVDITFVNPLKVEEKVRSNSDAIDTIERLEMDKIILVHETYPLSKRIKKSEDLSQDSFYTWATHFPELTEEVYPKLIQLGNILESIPPEAIPLTRAYILKNLDDIDKRYHPNSKLIPFEKYFEDLDAR